MAGNQHVVYPWAFINCSATMPRFPLKKSQRRWTRHSRIMRLADALKQSGFCRVSGFNRYRYDWCHARDLDRVRRILMPGTRRAHAVAVAHAAECVLHFVKGYST
jgi:hypothetical protein